MVASNTWAAGFYQYSSYWRKLVPYIYIYITYAVHPKGNQSWIFIGRTDAEAETPILWPPDVKKWDIWKDLDAGKDWRWEEKGTTEDEMVGWHHRLNGQWIWVSSESWWWTWRPGMLQAMGSQKVRHDWVSELNWCGALNFLKISKIKE